LFDFHSAVIGTDCYAHCFLAHQVLVLKDEPEMHCGAVIFNHELQHGRLFSLRR
jgi:hypothetical protein